MAQLIDRVPEDQQESEEFATLDEQQEQVEEAPEEPTPQPEVEDDIPEKYRGKELKDIVQMHQEAEKLLGR